MFWNYQNHEWPRMTSVHAVKSRDCNQLKIKTLLVNVYWSGLTILPDLTVITVFQLYQGSFISLASLPQSIFQELIGQEWPIYDLFCQLFDHFMTIPIGNDLQEFFKSPCSRGGDSFASGNLEDQDLCDCIIEGRDPSIRFHQTVRTSDIFLYPSEITRGSLKRTTI